MSNSQIVHKVLTSLAGTVVLGASVMVYVSSNLVNPFLVADRIVSADRPNLKLRATIEREIASGSTQEAMIFAMHGGKQIAAGVDRRDSLPFNSSVSMAMTRGQRTTLAGAMSNSGTQQAVIWAPCCTPALVTDLFQAAGFQNFLFSAVGEDGSGPLVVRRSSPMGLLYASSPDGVFSVEVEANKRSLSLQSPEEYESSFMLRISTSSSAGDSRKLFHRHRGLFVLNDVKISNSGVVVMGGSTYLLDESSKTYRWAAQVQAIDKFGNLIWSRSFLDLFATINSVQISSSGAVLVGGGSFGDPSDDTMAYGHATLKDSFLIHLDESGKTLSSEYENLGGNDQIISVNYFDHDGFVFVVSSEGPNPHLLWGVASTKLLTSAFNQPLKKIGECSGIQTLFEPMTFGSRNELTVKTSCSIGSNVQYQLDVIRLK